MEWISLPAIYLCIGQESEENSSFFDSIYIFWSNFHSLATESFFFVIKPLEFVGH